MNRFRGGLLILVFIVCTIAPAFAIAPGDLDPINSPALSPATFAEQLLPGATIVPGSANYAGADQATGAFRAGFADGIGIDAGFILTSGDILGAVGPNIASGPGVFNNAAGDPDLDALAAPSMTADASVLTFSFSIADPIRRVVTFQAVFASEEYNESVGDPEGIGNDVFGLFVDGVNIALAPGTGSPVTVNTINGSATPALFNNNDPEQFIPSTPFGTQYDGFSQVMTFRVVLDPDPAVTHTLKVAVADAGPGPLPDNAVDSAVFLAPATFTAAPAAAVIMGDFDDNAIDDMAIIDADGFVFFSTNVNFFAPAWNHVTGQVFSKIVSGDFNPGRQGDELAGVALNGSVFFSNDMLTWTQIPLGGTLTTLVSGNFNNARAGHELAGLDPAGNILVTMGADITTGFSKVNGKLAQLTAGDVNNDGLTDLIGLSSAGKIWVSTTAGATWTNVPGTLSKIISADLNGDINFDIAGLSPTGKIWYTTTFPAPTWTNVVPGTLNTMTSGDFGVAVAGDQLAGLSATGKVWYTPNLPVPAWTSVPGTLTQLITGDFDGDGTDDLAGVSPAGKLFMSINKLNFIEVVR